MAKDGNVLDINEVPRGGGRGVETFVRMAAIKIDWSCMTHACICLAVILKLRHNILDIKEIE